MTTKKILPTVIAASAAALLLFPTQVSAQMGQSEWIRPAGSMAPAEPPKSGHAFGRHKKGAVVTNVGQSEWIQPAGQALEQGGGVMLNAGGAGSEMLSGNVVQSQDADLNQQPMQDQTQEPMQDMQQPMQPMQPMQTMQPQQQQAFEPQQQPQFVQNAAPMQQFSQNQMPVQQFVPVNAAPQQPAMPVVQNDSSMESVVFGMPAGSGGMAGGNSVSNALSTAATVGVLGAAAAGSLGTALQGMGFNNHFHTYGPAMNGTFYADGHGSGGTVVGGSGIKSIGRSVTRGVTRGVDRAATIGTYKLINKLMYH
jgi:hypothetical protein